MTDLLLDYDPNDTGEVARLPGEETVRIPGEHRRRIETGEPTQRIDPRLIKAPSFEAVPRPVFEIDDTVVYHLPPTIGIVPDLASAQPISPPERVAGADDTVVQTLLQGLGADLPEDGDGVVFRRPCGIPRSRRSVPYVLPADRRPWSGARHAKPAPLWTRVAIVVGGAMAAGGGIGLGLIWAVVR